MSPKLKLRFIQDIRGLLSSLQVCWSGAAHVHQRRSDNPSCEHRHADQNQFLLSVWIRFISNTRLKLFSQTLGHLHSDYTSSDSLCVFILFSFLFFRYIWSLCVCVVGGGWFALCRMNFSCIVSLTLVLFSPFWNF